MNWLINEFSWMQWNWAGTLFFVFILLSITALTVWDILIPENSRKGFLPMVTTRGDRLFIGIITSIGLMLLWLAFAGNQALWVASALLVAWNGVLALRG